MLRNAQSIGAGGIGSGAATQNGNGYNVIDEQFSDRV